MTEEERALRQQWLEHARKLASHSRFDHAISALQQALKTFPDDEELLARLLPIVPQTDDPARAVEIYQELLGRRGPWIDAIRPELYLRLGSLLLQLGQAEQALRELRQAMELRPENCDVHLALGRAYLQTEDYRMAIGEFQEVVRLSLSSNGGEQTAQAYQGMGEAMAARGRGRPEWFCQAAKEYQKLGDREKAYPLFARALELDPNCQEAATALERLRSTPAPPDPSLYANAQMRRDRGDIVGALQEYETLLQLFPTDREALLRRSECLRLLERHEEARLNDQILANL